MQRWQTKVVCAGRYRPRQFEYHPLHEDVLVFGTVRGEAVVVDLSKNTVISSISSGLSKDRRDSILGLCWLKHRPNHFVVGSSNGFLRLCESGPIPSTSTEESLTAADMSGGDWVIQPRYEGLRDNFFPLGSRIVKEFGRFERLTSVHVNSTDDHMLVSGYTSGVSLFDISTGSVIRDFQDIHGDHINISRFANHSPFVFATSSFDCTVKAWDSRMPSETPIYTCQSDKGHVMLSFSPDDGFLLTSAVDNEVKQYLAVDGTLYMDLDLPRTGLKENFTRSYYTSSGRMILSGSSEEQMVRLYCSQTGRMVHETVMYAGRKHGSLYVQSLRGDPHHDHRFSVLVNYRDPSYPLEIINVDMLKGSDGEDLRSQVAHTTTARLSSDLGRACRMKADADIYLVARNRFRFAAHKAILSCRCRVLGRLIDKAVAERRALISVGAYKKTAADVEPQRQPRLKIDHDDFMDWESISVSLPRAVAPEIVPVVLEYLYTDKLHVETNDEDNGYARANVDPRTGDAAEGDTRGDTRRHSGRSKWNIESTARARALMIKRSSGQHTQSEVIIFEKLLEAAKALELERLSCLVEWQCSQLVDTVTVVDLATMALRFRREQLLKFCVHFLVSHLSAVLVLHGSDCLSLHLQIRVDAERERRQYALNRGPEDSMRLTRDASAMQHTHQQAATGATGAAPTGLGGQADNGSNAGHGGNTLGAALAAAAAAVSAALGNVQAVGGGQGAGGAAPAMGAAAAQAQAEVGAALPNIANGASAQNGHGVFEANGYHGYGEADEDDGLEVPMDVEDDDEDDDLEDGDDDDMGDEDDIVDEEVDSTMSGDDSGEDDEGPWIDPSQCGENLPADVRRRLVPSSNGHSGTAVFGSHMVVIGGNNRRQVHSCRHVLLYDPVERTWSKMPTRGNAPSCLVYHSCTELEPPWAVQRNLLIIGGPRQMPPRSKAPVLVLDCLTMEWSRPIISGRYLADRTRHTAVAVFSEGMADRVIDRGNGGQTQDRRFGHPSADDEDLATTRRGKWDEKTAGLGRTRDDGGETNVVIFGGYMPTHNGEVFNDVVVLNVIRLSREQRHGHGHGRSEQQSWGDPDDSLASEDKDASFNLDGDSCLDYDDCGGKNVCTRSSQGYRYRWVWPMVLGTPPAARLAHAAAVVRILGRGDSFIHGGRGREAYKGARNVSYMVVFGGVGEEDVFNDVGVLKCTAGMEWITVQVNGRRPARRFGHSMVALTSGSSENYGKLAVFGGTSGRYIFNDLFLLTINPGTDVNGVPRVKAEWEHLARRTLGVMPSPRSRLSMCLIKGELIIFGGTDQTTGVNNVVPLQREVDSFVYHVRPRIFERSLPRPLAIPEGTAAFHLTGTVDSVAFRHGGGSGGSASSSGALFVQRRQVHERAMAREVASRMNMVQAAEIRRTISGAASFERLGRALFRSPTGSPPGSPFKPLPMGLTNAASGDGYGMELTAEEADLITGPPAQRSLGGGVVAGNPRAFSGNGNGFSWQLASPFGDTSAGGSGMRTHEPHVSRHPNLSGWSGARSRSSVHILWESIRPQVFVCDAGPEPPIYAPPSALHVEMGSLIGNAKFSDVEFRLQAVDYTLPTTPTNTAHYAIVPPLTPSTLTTASGPVSPKDMKCPPSPFSFSFPDQPTDGIAASIASGAGGPSSMTSERAGAHSRTSTAPSILPRGDGHALGGPLGSNLGMSMLASSHRDRRSVVPGASRVGNSEGLGANMTRAHRVGTALSISPDSASPLHYRRMSRANANGGDGTVVGPDELARQSRLSHADTLSPSSGMMELFSLSPFGASRGDGGGLGCNNRGSSPVRTSSGGGLRFPAPSTSERGPVEKVWRWECVDVDAGRAVAGDAGVEEKCDDHSSGVMDKAVTARSSAGKEPALDVSPVTSPKANAMPFSPSRAWEVLAELVLSTTPSPTYSACSAAEGNCRGFFGSLEVESDAEGNHAAPRDDGVGWVGEGGHLRGGLHRSSGVSANGGSGTERFHAHRFVVALRSDPMRAMLHSGMRETFDRDALVKDIRPSVFSSLLTYIYTDNLQLERPQDIMELLVAANQYTLGELVCLCEGFLQGVLDEDNACHLYHYADALGMPTFEHRVLTFILRNWGRVTRTEGWRVLPEELRVRANNFRTRETHIFMLNHKDHVKWEGDWKMADWVYEKARIPTVPASPEEKEWCDEVMRVRNKMLAASLMADERRRSIRNITSGE